jgi:hypothetical protein
VRGGGTSERHRVDRKRLQSAPQPLQLRLLDAGAGAAGIDKPAVWIVVGEQQRAEPWPAAFGIGPADDDKFLAVKAFDLEPQATVGGGIGCIGAFRDDALELPPFKACVGWG